MRKNQIRKNQVKLGHVYQVKIRGIFYPVRLDSKEEVGWIGTNLNNLKKVKIKSSLLLKKEYKYLTQIECAN